MNNPTLFLLLTLSLALYQNCIGQSVQLKIKGQNAHQDSIINNLGYKNDHSSTQDIKKTLLDLNNQLEKMGFLDIQTSQFNSLGDSLYIAEINIGKLQENILLITSQEVLYNQLLKLHVNRHESSFEIKLNSLDSLFNKILELENSIGHLFSQIELTNIKKTNNKLQAELILTRERDRKIDSIVVKGYEKFPKSYLKRFAHIYKDKVFNKSAILDGNEKISTLPFAQTIKDPEILFKEDTTVVYLYIGQKSANNFDGLLGFGSDQNTGKLKFNGYLDLNLLNNLNYGESLSIKYKGESQDQQSFNATLSLPYLLKSPIGTTLSLNLFRRDSIFSSVEQNLNIHFNVNNTIKIKGIASIKSSTTLATTTETIAYSDYTKSLFGLGVELNPIYTKQTLNKPWHFNLGLMLGSRKISNSRKEQFKIEAESGYNFQITPKQGFYITNTTQFLDSKDYFTNELFRIGGISTIRGYKENSISANFQSTTQTEYRYKLSPAFLIHTITDFSYFENKIDNTEEVLSSLGFGAALNTNSGLVKLSLASALQKDTPFKLGDTILYFQIISNF